MVERAVAGEFAAFAVAERQISNAAINAHKAALRMLASYRIVKYGALSFRD
jgi:hypothetical protein